MKRMERDEWLALGESLFGKDMKKWRFRCVRCGHVQSFETFQERTAIPPADIQRYVYFSCEGRWNPDVGCDWTLGGLFQIHALEVAYQGEFRQAFEFDHDDADAPTSPEVCRAAGGTGSWRK